MKRADDFVAEFGIFGKDDLVWIVIDMDRWQEAHLANVAKKCEQKEKYRLILSNPCFELWLFLHLKAPSQTLTGLKTCKDFKKALKIEMGAYNPSNPDFSSLFPNTHIAIENAKVLDTAEKERFPNQISARVYQLVEPLMAFRSPLKRL